MFGIVTLLGFDYRPVLVDLPDTKLWRIDAAADYGVLDKTARGRVDELYQAYHAGMEDQLGALGLVLNCITLWNTLYLNHALDALRGQGYPALDADAARLSAYQHKNINVHGHYTFALPDLGGERRPLRDPDRVEE